MSANGPRLANVDATAARARRWELAPTFCLLEGTDHIAAGHAQGYREIAVEFVGAVGADPVVQRLFGSTSRGAAVAKP
jgi:hypothetical protein